MIQKQDFKIRDEAKIFALETAEPLMQSLPDDPSETVAVFALARKHGYCGLGTSKELGGKGYSHLQSVLAYEGLAYGDPLFAVLIQLHNNITQMTESVAETDTVRTAVREMALGEKLSAFALTETSAGSDPGANQGTACKDEEGYRLFGEKNWVTGGTAADYILTFMRKSGEKGMYLFLLDRDTPGMKIRPMEELLCGSIVGEAAITYDNCLVPPERMLTERGYQLALHTIDVARVYVPALCVGLAQRALEECVEYLRGRDSMGGPILGKSSIQWQLAELETKIEAARQLLYCAAETLDAGEPITLMAAKNKLFAPQVALEAAALCVQLHGGRGLYRAAFPARAMVCAKMFSVMDGTSEMQKVILGRNLEKIVPGCRSN